MKKILLFILLILLSGCAVSQSDNFVTPSKDSIDNDSPSYYEECFNLVDVSVGVEQIDGSPSQYFQNNDVQAVINGVYWGADDNKTQGVMYSPSTDNIGTKKGLISGYLTIKDNTISTQEFLEDFLGYDLVVGTHPLLVSNNKISVQSLEQRYNQISTLRTAIGSKKGNDICLMISTQGFLMKEWAELLLKNDYQSAINLDGGSVAQIASKNTIVGTGLQKTKSVIYVK